MLSLNIRKIFNLRDWLFPSPKPSTPVVQDVDKSEREMYADAFCERLQLFRRLVILVDRREALNSPFYDRADEAYKDEIRVARETVDAEIAFVSKNIEALDKVTVTLSNKIWNTTLEAQVDVERAAKAADVLHGSGLSYRSRFRL
jgi:hypothetical protein